MSNSVTSLPTEAVVYSWESAYVPIVFEEMRIGDDVAVLEPRLKRRIDRCVAKVRRMLAETGKLKVIKPNEVDEIHIGHHLKLVKVAQTTLEQHNGSCYVRVRREYEVTG